MTGDFSVRQKSIVYFPGIVTTANAIELLEKFRDGKVSLKETLAAFQAPPVADLGFAQVDAHRALRKGFAEVVYCAGKTSAQIVADRRENPGARGEPVVDAAERGTGGLRQEEIQTRAAPRGGPLHHYRNAATGEATRNDRGGMRGDQRFAGGRGSVRDGGNHGQHGRADL